MSRGVVVPMPRSCARCSGPIPPHRHRSARYCKDACRIDAAQARRGGLPRAIPPSTQACTAPAKVGALAPLILVLIVTTTSALAWEADGFRSGSDVAVVAQELASWGVERPQRAPLSGSNAAYVIESQKRWFLFCNDILYEYVRSFDVRMPSFAKMLQTEVERLGPPLTVHAGPPIGAEKGIWFSWSLGPGQIFQLIVEGDDTLSASRRFVDVKVAEPCG